MKFAKVDLKNIEQNENSRVIYKEADLSELMHSMKQDGLLQPVALRDLGKGKYEAIFGNRRITAARKLGWADIDATIVKADSDNERDFLNLIENIKRQNISVTEEGRLYAVLGDRGLKPAEIAARLGVNLTRVETALDAVKHVPKDMAQKVVNRVGGAKRRGTLSATAYHTLSNLRKSQKLNRKQFRSLLEYATQDGVSTSHVYRISPLVRQGFTIDEAVTKADSVDRLAFEMFIDRKHRDKLETKYGLGIYDIVYKALEAMPELKLHRRLKGTYNSKVIRRHAATA